MILPVTRKQNIKISVKTSDSPEGLLLKIGEIGTDGENLFIGKINGNFSITVPIGSIVFWVPVYFSNSLNGSPVSISNLLTIPPGWKVADGSKIEDDSSLYNGYFIPNLTGDIFIQGSNITNAGLTGGNNESYHKHNIAHHHTTFNGANNNAGYISVDGDHRHSFNDSNTAISFPGEPNGRHPAFGITITGRTTEPAGSHVHNINHSDVGDVSTVFVNSNYHLNSGNPRTIDNTADFFENRPKYMNGVFLIKIK